MSATQNHKPKSRKEVKEETQVRRILDAALFKQERLTKNSVRFQEVVEAGFPYVVGSIYVQKEALDGTPEAIRVTIDVEPEPKPARDYAKLNPEK